MKHSGVALALGALLAVGGWYGWQWWQVGRHLRDAQTALASGDFDAAMDSIMLAQPAAREDAELAYLLAVTHRRAGRMSLFETYIDRAAEGGYSPADVERQRWLAVAQVGNYAAVASKVLETTERGAPDDVAEEVYEAVAKGYMSTYRLRDAWQCLDTWLQWRPDAPWARFMRALIYERIDNAADAIEDYQVALAGMPNNREFRLNLGRTLMDAQRVEEARDVFAAGLALAPDDREFLLRCVQCARQFGDAAEVRRLLDRIDSNGLSPEQQAMLFAEQGRLLLDEDKPREAVEVLSRAVDLDPLDHATLRVLATALTRSGQTENTRLTQERMQRVSLATERMAVLSTQLKDAPNNADARFEMGFILIQLGKVEEGLHWLKTSLDCNPAHVPANQVLAEYFVSRGDQQAAAYHRMMAARGAKALPAKPATPAALPKAPSTPGVAPQPSPADGKTLSQEKKTSVPEKSKSAKP